MGIFLLFNESRRLVRTSSVAGRYGQNEPLSMFFNSDDQERGTHEALEVNPEILRQIRPDVFAAIQLHARLARNGIQVDTLEEIRARTLKQLVYAAEWAIFTTARDVLLSKGVLEELGFPMEAPANYVETREAELDRARQRLHDIREGVISAEIPQLLVDLAGKLLPI